MLYEPLAPTGGFDACPAEHRTRLLLVHQSRLPLFTDRKVLRTAPLMVHFTTGILTTLSPRVTPNGYGGKRAISRTRRCDVDHRKVQLPARLDPFVAANPFSAGFGRATFKVFDRRPPGGDTGRERESWRDVDVLVR